MYNQNNVKNFKIIYLNNVVRREIGTVDLDLNSSKEIILKQIQQIYESKHSDAECSYTRIYVKDSMNNLVPFHIDLFRHDEISEIYITEIVKPDVAVNFLEFDGIKFYFHTDESSHSFAPHVHASNGDKVISISLASPEFLVKGKLKGSKHKKAIDYVRENSEIFIDGWRKYCIH